MDKRKPSYDLDAVKAAFATENKLRVTGSAIRTAALLGFGRTEIVATIQIMQRQHFFKSMTSYGNHRIWQDVYHVPSAVGTLYLKFAIDTTAGFILLSFKEKDE